MATLQDLEAAYLNQQKEVEAQAVAEQQALKEQRQQILDELKPRIINYLAKREGVDTQELDQYGSISGQWDEWGNQPTKLNRAIFWLSVPDHVKVSFSFYLDTEGKLLPNNKWWNVEDSGQSSESLGVALALAGQAWQSQKAYQEREEADSLSWKTEQAALKERKQREIDESRRIIEQVASDPAAVLLLKLFAAIQAERGQTADQIERLNEQYSDAVYHYDNQLSKAKEQAHSYQQQAEQSANNARSLEYQVSDLESNLKKAKRQLAQ